MKTKFAEFLESLNRDGTVVDSGQSFVVHLTKSREKMAMFQKTDPTFCFLKWYQAAVVGGAKEIFFEMELDHYLMVIPFPEKLELGEICRAFEGDQAELVRRDRLFLEGLLAATSAGMETSLSTDEESHVLTSGRLEKANWWSRLASYRKVYKKHSVRLAVRVAYSCDNREKIINNIAQRTRLGPIVCYFVLDASSKTEVLEPEVPVFEDMVTRGRWFEKFSRKPHLLEAWIKDGPLLRKRERKLTHSNSLRNPKSLLSQTKSSSGVAILVSLEFEGPAKLIPVQHGVCLQPIFVDLGLPGVTIAFNADDMKTDLSGFKLIEDESALEKIEELKQLALSVVQEHQSKIDKLDAREQYRLHPFGTLPAAFLGYLVSINSAFVFQLLLIPMAAGLGWFAERRYRREELERARDAHTAAFRAEIRKRLPTLTEA